MALTEDLHSLVSTVADAMARHEAGAIAGHPPVTGHAYYDGGAVAVLSTITWLATHGDHWDRDRLLETLGELSDAMARKDWAYLEGGPKHGG